MDIANYTCIICRHYILCATFAHLFFRIFEQYATLDNTWKWKKFMGWLAQKKDLILRILIDFMDFKTESIVAYKTLCKGVVTSMKSQGDSTISLEAISEN